MADDPPVTPATTLPAAPADASDDLMVGRKVGAYEVVRRIGQGGMGVVYAARHAKLEQRAAIKFLHQEFSRDDKLLQRFFNEARAISMSRHESIVTIYDFGQLDDGTAYILMEFLEGESLLTRMENTHATGKPLGLHMVVELGRQVAAAMALIHSKSIVHRDLKPENIFVVPDSVAPLGERVKLLDFGIVKFLEGPVRKTTVGMILGTPLYMSPEQCEGAEDLDAKVDVYSLGVMLYEMLCGHLPFIADTAAALMRQHMFKEPPPLRDEVKDLPEELDGLITQMLAKKAADRPSMEEVLEVLEALLPTVATSGRPVTGGRRGLGARSRPSQPDPAADPFAATLGGAAASTGSNKLSARSSGGMVAAVTPIEGLGVPTAPLTSTGSGPVVTGSPGRVLVSSASQSGLLSLPLSRPGFNPSEASRTDAVIALARRPVSLFVALALLFVLFAFGWRLLALKPGPEQPRGQSTSAGGAPPQATPPPPPGPPPTPAPAPPRPIQPSPPTAVPTSPPEGPDRGDTKHHGKRHKKLTDATGKAEDGETGAAEPSTKKPRAVQAKVNGEAWDPDKL